MSGLSTEERRVCEGIRARRSEMLEDLRRLVEIPTGPGGERGLEETRGIFAGRLSRLGAGVEEVPGDPRPGWLETGRTEGVVQPTLVARRGGAGMRVLIVGHLDTVHPAMGPFRYLAMSADGTRAMGPGCVDMKGGLTIALHALEALEEAGERVAWTVALNSDEETGSFYSDRALRGLAKEHDVGLALEPAMADGGLVVERAGSGQFMLECVGRSAHVGRDFSSGVSAVNELARCILRVAEIPRPSEGIVANVGPLEGGVAANVVPDRARAWGNVRFPNAEAGRMLEGTLRGMATVPGAMPGVRVEVSLNRPAKPMTDGVRRLAELARGAAEDLGQRLPFGKTGGVCDGNNLQGAGLATIDTLGVRGGGLHTPEEWIEVGSLVERSELLAVVMMRLARGAWRRA